MNDARAYERHLSNQDVEQLRLIHQALPAQKTAYSGNARIPLQLHVLLVFPHKFRMFCQVFVCIGSHRPELESEKTTPTLTNDLSEMKDGPSIIKLDTRCDY